LIGYLLERGPDKFHTFQGPTRESYPSHQLEFNNNQKEDTQISHQILGNNVSHWAHLEMMANELAVEQKEDSFFTQPVLDPRPNRPMSI